MIEGGDNGLELAMREIGCCRSGNRFESLVAATTLIMAYGVCLLLLREAYVNFTVFTVNGNGSGREA